MSEIEVVIFIIIGLVSTLMLGFVALNPYEAGSSVLRSEAARLNALNIASSLSLLHSHPDAVFEYAIELKDCEIQILSNSIIVKSGGKTGIAYMVESDLDIQEGKINCIPNMITYLVFKKQGNKITFAIQDKTQGGI